MMRVEDFLRAREMSQETPEQAAHHERLKRRVVTSTLELVDPEETVITHQMAVEPEGVYVYGPDVEGEVTEETRHAREENGWSIMYPMRRVLQIRSEWTTPDIVDVQTDGPSPYL